MPHITQTRDRTVDGASWVRQSHVHSRRGWQPPLLRQSLSSLKHSSKLRIMQPWQLQYKSSLLSAQSNSVSDTIGHSHDGVILLLSPEYFRALLFCANYGFCYLNLTRITKFNYERKNEMNSGLSSKQASSCK